MERENADGDRKKAPWKVQNKILKILSTATNSALSLFWVCEVFRKNKKDLFRPPSSVILCYVIVHVIVHISYSTYKLFYFPCYRPYSNVIVHISYSFYSIVSVLCYRPCYRP